MEEDAQETQVPKRQEIPEKTPEEDFQRTTPVPAIREIDETKLDSKKETPSFTPKDQVAQQAQNSRMQNIFYKSHDQKGREDREEFVYESIEEIRDVSQDALKEQEEE